MPYPIFLNLKGRRCVIVGGGRVAERRADGLMPQECEISIIAPQATQRIAEWSEQESNIQWTRTVFEPYLLDGAFLAVAATDNAVVNDAVAVAARQRRIIVCRVDQPEGGDFVTPAVMERGTLTIALSTGGASPTLTAALMVRLREFFGPEWNAFTAVFAKLRPEIQTLRSEEARKIWVDRILQSEAVLNQVRAGDVDAATREAMRCI